jgi:hypothetical protein
MLDWKAKPERVTRATHPKFQTQLTVKASAGELAELRDELARAVAGGEELRWELEHGWRIYFKLRAGASRVQLAHPQLYEWVATLSLSQGHFDRLLESLDAAARQEGVVVELNRLADPARSRTLNS